MTARRWLREFTNEGDVIFRLGRAGDALIAEWPGFAELHASRDGASYELRPVEGADPIFVEKFHGGLVRALLRHLRGEHTLHGSCVARDDRAAVLVGDSGDGKSSLAAAACLRDGVALLADDTTPIVRASDGRVMASPSETVCWLRGDDRKAPSPVPRCAESPAEIVAIVRLVWEDRDRPELRRIGGARAFDHLARALFRFVVDEPEVELRDFAFVATLADTVPIYELARPRDLGQLSDTAELVVELLADKGRARGS